MPLSDMKALDVVRAHYAEAKAQKTYNWLLIGPMGTSKTYMARTMPGPGIIWSFDPGGTKGLDREIASGKIVVDTRYEEEDPEHPTAFNLFIEEVTRLWNAGVFKDLAAENGFAYLDSGTMMAEALMYHILQKASRAGQAPQLQDYNVHISTMNRILKRLTSIPCHFVMTGHIDTVTSELDGKTVSSLMAFGKNKVKIPLLFDEVYVTSVSPTLKEGPVYKVYTQTSGRLEARTRLGRGGIFEPQEPADFSLLLEKAAKAREKEDVKQVKEASMS